MGGRHSCCKPRGCLKIEQDPDASFWTDNTQKRITFTLPSIVITDEKNRDHILYEPKVTIQSELRSAPTSPFDVKSRRRRRLSSLPPEQAALYRRREETIETVSVGSVVVEGTLPIPKEAERGEAVPSCSTTDKQEGNTDEDGLELRTDLHGAS